MCKKESWGAITAPTEVQSTCARKGQPPRMHGSSYPISPYSLLLHLLRYLFIEPYLIVATLVKSCNPGE